MITEYNDYCIICGKPREDIHHLCFGNASRRLSDDDSLVLPLCRKHHAMMHEESIRQYCNSDKQELDEYRKVIPLLSRIIGQLAWEREYLIDRTLLPFDEADEISKEAREAFRSRYGRSYL